MASFATAAQMEQHSQGAITAATHPALEQKLAAATRRIRDYCGWHIAQLETRTFTRRSRHVSDVWIPAMQIASIDGVSGAGVTLDLSTVEFDPDTGWTNIRAASVVVDYTAGFETVPEDLVALTCQVAARALGSPLGLIREQAGAVSAAPTLVAPNAAGGVVLMRHEKDELATYRIGALP